jgi:hypothetical protein
MPEKKSVKKEIESSSRGTHTQCRAVKRQKQADACGELTRVRWIQEKEKKTTRSLITKKKCLSGASTGRWKHEKEKSHAFVDLKKKDACRAQRRGRWIQPRRRGTRTGWTWLVCSSATA